MIENGKMYLSGHVWNTERKKLSNFVSLNFNRFQVFFVTICSSLHAFNIQFSMKVMLSESAVITCFSAVFFFLMFNVNFGTFLSWVILFHIKTLSLEKKIAWKKQREERKNFFAYKFILSVLFSAFNWIQMKMNRTDWLELNSKSCLVFHSSARN